MNLEPIGIARCGRMGAPMLGALLHGGFDARGLDIRPSAEFGGLAKNITSDPAQFAAGLKTLVTVVRDINQTDDVLFGEQSIVTRADQLRTVIVCSTLSPKYVKALRSRIPDHIVLIDAPMSGAQVGAENRTLSFMLGGEPEDLNAHQPLFEAMGKHFHRMGPFGAGMQTKVLNNLLAASHTAMTRLVLDWADEAGLDEKTLLDLIATSSGQNWLASGFDEIEFSRDGHCDDNTIGILVKDVESALDAAPQTADTTLPRAIQNYIGKLKARS